VSTITDPRLPEYHKYSTQDAGASLFRERPSNSHIQNQRGVHRTKMTTTRKRIRTLPTPREVREIFCNYVNANMDDDSLGSYREISEAVSRISGRYTSHATIVRWMLAEFPYITERMRENSPHFGRALGATA
jgi:hypothetical protein